MLLNNIPLDILNIVNPIANNNKELLRLNSLNEQVLRFDSLSEDSNFYFVIEEYKETKKSLVLIVDYQPKNSHGVYNHRTKVDISELRGKIENWVLLIKSYNNVLYEIPDSHIESNLEKISSAKGIKKVFNKGLSKMLDLYRKSTLVSGVFSGLLFVTIYSLGRLFPAIIDSLIIFIVGFILALIFAPFRRFMKAFWSILSILLTAHIIPFSKILIRDKEGSFENNNGFRDFLLEITSKPPELAFTMTLGVLAVVCLILDYKQRNKS